MTAKRPKIKLIAVYWFDASFQRGEACVKELDTECNLITVGILAGETKSHISIALETYPGYDQFRYIVHIPRANVLKIKRMTLTAF